MATHEISLHGVSGAIFWLIMSAVIFYVLGFATVGWEKAGSTWIGLWATCSSSIHYYDNERDRDWFRATEAMMTIGLILLLAGAIAIFLYMFIHSTSLSKNKLIIAFTAIGFAAVTFMLIGLVIFGAKHNERFDIHWSYAFSVIGAGFCLIASILAVVQMKQSNVI